MPEEEKKEFVVNDRRFFSQQNTEAGENTDEGARKKEPPVDAEKNKPAEEKQDRKPKPDKAKRPTPLPVVDFATFILSLNSSALVQLGVIEDPGTKSKQKNLPIAKQTIDIIGMLEEKTRGNLTREEENILTNLLHDLRMLYVRESG